MACPVSQVEEVEEEVVGGEKVGGCGGAGDGGHGTRDVTNKEGGGGRPLALARLIWALDCTTGPPDGGHGAPGTGQRGNEVRRGGRGGEYSPLVQLQQRLGLARLELRLGLQGLLVLAQNPLKLHVRPVFEELCTH